YTFPPNSLLVSYITILCTSHLASATNKDTSSVSTGIDLSNFPQICGKWDSINSTESPRATQVGPGSTIIIRSVDAILTIDPASNKDALLSVLLGSDRETVGLGWAWDLGEGL